MQLYYRPGTCALGPHIVLEWMKADYKLVLADFKDPNYQKINPLLAVPALATDDLGVLTQNDGILAYLVRQPGGAEFGPSDNTRSIYETAHWCAYLTGDIHPAFYPFFVPVRYTTEDSDEGRKKVKDSAPKRIAFVFQVLENHLASRQFIEGSRKSIVDAYAFPMVRWLKSGLPDVYATFPAITKWYDGMSTDEGVKSALVAQGITA